MSDADHQLDRLKTAVADRYRIERELGRGGMATVYLAEDLKNQRPVAIKVLKPEIAAGLGPDRFLREISVTAKLDHPHILPLHDSGESDGFFFYVMPYVEGESLRDRLNREKQLSIDDAIQITREVADALDFAHRHDVIHRDIKPENIAIFLLKGLRPEQYRDGMEMRGTLANINLHLLPDPLIERIANGENVLSVLASAVPVYGEQIRAALGAGQAERPGDRDRE